MKGYRKLIVWQKSMDLVEKVYLITQDIPKKEQFGLISQIQRAAVSVPANIAEGYGRMHPGDYLRHLSIARGSLMELETHLTILVRLKYVPREKALEIWPILQEINRMLTSMILNMKKKIEQK